MSLKEKTVIREADAAAAETMEPGPGPGPGLELGNVNGNADSLDDAELESGRDDPLGALVKEALAGGRRR